MANGFEPVPRPGSDPVQYRTQNPFIYDCESPFIVTMTHEELEWLFPLNSRYRVRKQPEKASFQHSEPSGSLVNIMIRLAPNLIWESAKICGRGRFISRTVPKLKKKSRCREEPLIERKRFENVRPPMQMNCMIGTTEMAKRGIRRCVIV